MIARINLLETFCEYTRARWKKEPTDSALKRIANIISWNLWQMDGIHGVIPQPGASNEAKANDEPEQLSIFDIMVIDEEPKATTPAAIACKIYDWRANKSVTYKSMNEE